MAGSREKRRNPNPGLIAPAPGLHNDLISWDVQILLDGGLSVAARLILNLTMMTHNRHNRQVVVKLAACVTFAKLVDHPPMGPATRYFDV